MIQARSDTYIGRDCNLARTTLLTPEITIIRKTMVSFQFHFRVDDEKSDSKSSGSSSYSNSGRRGRDKSSSSNKFVLSFEASEKSSSDGGDDCRLVLIADQLETRRSNKFRLV